MKFKSLLKEYIWYWFFFFLQLNAYQIMIRFFYIFRTMDGYVNILLKFFIIHFKNVSLIKFWFKNKTFIIFKIIAKNRQVILFHKVIKSSILLHELEYLINTQWLKLKYTSYNYQFHCYILELSLTPSGSVMQLWSSYISDKDLHEKNKIWRIWTYNWLNP